MPLYHSSRWSGTIRSNCGIPLPADSVGRALAGTLGQEVNTPTSRRPHGSMQERIPEPLKHGHQLDAPARRRAGSVVSSVEVKS